jgi:hypothetical protein
MEQRDQLTQIRIARQPLQPDMQISSLPTHSCDAGDFLQPAEEGRFVT